MRPLARALIARGIVPTLVFTGQHPGLKRGEFGLDGLPCLDLGCPGEPNPHGHVRTVTKALLPLLRDGPDLLMVQGDTSSALGAALAGFVGGIPVGHVEAGLRTHDPRLPWPEEEYRVAIDADAELLFAPTETSAANLRKEEVPGEIHITGNTGVDATLETAKRLPPAKLRENARRNILVTCHRRESWDGGLPSIAAALKEIARDGDVSVDFVLHPNSFVRSNMQRMLEGARGISLLEPCGHQELLRRMRDSHLVLSDSGGIQEEAPVLGVPLLVLRDKTERPEGIVAGTSILVGTDRARIVDQTRRLLDDPATRLSMSRPTLPFGDGRAGERIGDIVVEWLQRRYRTRQLA